MIDPEQINADHAFWNGQGGHTWVARQEHTDITLAPMTEALLAFAAPCPTIFLSTLFFRARGVLYGADARNRNESADLTATRTYQAAPGGRH